ncbi:natural cytotoxicity triggering receptor 3 isoform X2 [Pelodiscus sinensis]|uniref:natural cytotoxicity triggering receptor 3 isoform X2 n=1 Tax=Pelodiscus sinensis TaxID=13735 RepID=UPI003F6C02C6
MTGLGGRAGGMRHGKPAGLWGGQGRGAAAGQGGQPEAGFRPSVGVPLRAPLAPLSLLSMTHVRWGWLDAATLWGRGLTLAPRLPGPMALRRLCLTLLACSGCWAQEVRVSQPGSVRAPEGGSVTLPCWYNSSRPAALGSYRWVKEEAGARLEVSDATLQFRGRVNGTPSRSFLQDRRADVRLRDLRPYDAGTYRCRVKIPTVGEGEGNGTRLLVVKAESPPAPADGRPDGFVLLWLFLRGLICTFGLALTAAGTSLFYVCQGSRRRQRRTRQIQRKPQPAM